MALFYQSELNEDTRFAIWHIEENEQFFSKTVALKKEILHPHKRLQHLAGRFLLPFLFSDFPQEEILIADSRKPFLKNDAYHFSISHCGNYAAAIVSKSQRVGIDIELFTDKVFKIKNKFLNDNELNIVKANGEGKKLLTTLWCAKEAVYKWYSFGKTIFRENILLQPFIFENDKTIPTIFLKQEDNYLLDVHYKLFDNISLAWVVA